MTINRLCLVLLCMFFFSCSQKKKNTADEASEEPMQEAPVVKNETGKKATYAIAAADSAYIQSILQELKGIEKFAVKDNFYILSSLLEHKGDSIRHKKVKDIIQRGEEYLREYYFEISDVKNGYIKYAPRGAEVTYTTVYWNLNDGSKLIATEGWGCGPVCSSDITFQRFKDGVYETLENEEIIPEMKALPQMLVPDYNEDENPDPFEFKYVLPRNGKNIQFCLDDNCVVLQWEEGMFIVKEE